MKYLVILFIGLSLMACNNELKPNEEQAVEEQVVNVYTQRHYPADEKLYAAFEAQTGIKVNIIKSSADQLIERLKMEGKNSPADLLITVDGGRLWRAKQSELIQKFESELLNKQVAPNFRDKNGYWYGLGFRSRVIVYNKANVKPDDLTTYAGLADSKWKGHVVVRSSENMYNQSLVAGMIAHKGEEAVEAWAKAVVNNLAYSPKGNDTDQIKAVANGNAYLTLVNSYYLARLLKSEDETDRKVAEAVGIIFPDQNELGSHINLSGASLCKYAPHKENAIKFLEYLTSTEAQTTITNGNNEYPVNPAVEPNEVLKNWGNFKMDSLNIEQLGYYNEQAVAVFNRAGWE